VKIVTLDDIVGSDRDVRGETWQARRLLLAADRMGFSLHDTIIEAGTETPMWYRNHLEAVYCIEGDGSIEAVDTGEVHEIGVGTVYALDQHDRHVLRARSRMRMVCVFNPPVTGRETHDETGAYPLLTEPDLDVAPVAAEEDAAPAMSPRAEAPAGATLPAAPRADDRYPSRFASRPSITDRLDPVVYGESDGPLDPATLTSYADDGFIVLDGLLAPHEVDELNAEVDRLAADPAQRERPEAIVEPDGSALRSLFAIHAGEGPLAAAARHPRLEAVARQLLGSEVYVHQSRVNLKPAFRGKEFYWHSDFETWHTEDGMPAMRALSCSVLLDDNQPWNGPLLTIAGSHKRYVTCVGETPDDHFAQSLRKQEVGTPDDDSLRTLAEEGRVAPCLGGPGTVVFFDCNMMHGSNGNITPRPRRNLFVVFNSVHNTLVEPFAAPAPRPEFVATRAGMPARRA
jgi:ectoine hydroxylase